MNKSIYKIIDGVEHKSCAKCEKFFIANEENFYRNSMIASYLSSRCIRCISEDHKENNKKKIKDLNIKSLHFKWTEEKTQLLKDLFATKGNEELAKILNTTLKSIEAKAVLLKLNKTKETRSRLISEAKRKRKQPKKTKKVLHNGMVLIFMPEHPFCDKRGYVYEHRYVVEQSIGRYLNVTEVVTHKNDNKGDNRIENLVMKDFYRYDVNPFDVYDDRIMGMTVNEIRAKYSISIRTYYRKLAQGEKISLEMEELDHDKDNI